MTSRRCTALGQMVMCENCESNSTFEDELEKNADNLVSNNVLEVLMTHCSEDTLSLRR